LLKILRHRYAHWVRDQSRRQKGAHTLESAVRQAASGPDAPLEVLARQESLQAALDALDDRYKEPFLLVFLEGLTCQDAAEFLDLPLGTVLSRIHRARQLLRQALERGQAPQASSAPPLRLYADPGDRNRTEGGGGRETGLGGIS
jgi:RNA polymerase sigma-70 factor (ECF subfamily)